MTNLFRFADAPDIDDIWETTLDVDVLIHTRPILITERDRFCLNYGSSYAAFELQSAVYQGLKEYGYKIFAQLRDQIHEHIDDFCNEAIKDALQAHTAHQTPHPRLRKHVDKRARQLLHQTLQTPELIARFIDQLLLKLHNLDAHQRLHEIYRLRAQLIAEGLPFSRNAPQIMADFFRQNCLILQVRSKLDDDTLELDFSHILPLCKDIYNDTIHGLIHRLETNPEFLDAILHQWVLPKLHERFHEVDRELDTFQFNGVTIERNIVITRLKAPSEWLQLADKLGTPLPLPALLQDTP